MSKLLGGTGLTDILTKIKNAFVAKSDTTAVTGVSVDSTPTANSTNLVESGGVKAYVDNAVPTDVVKYALQSLTTSQKKQARSNIDTTRITDVVLLRSWTYSTFITYAVNGKTADWAVGESDVDKLNVGDIITIKVTISDRGSCEGYILAQGIGVVNPNNRYYPCKTLFAASNYLPDISGKENTSNKVTSLSSSSTDAQYPSAKSVYDFVKPATQSSQPAGGMLPGVLYKLGSLTGSVTFSLASAVSGIMNHYYWTFETGSTAPTITWPASITSWKGGAAPTINANKHYEISVLEGIGVFMEV